jgi:DegV family protein with EDD domain
MSKVAVVTDSVASLPEEIFQELDIHWVAYYIHRGKEILRDLVTVQRAEFLDWLTTARTLPVTASPGPGDYMEIYEKLAEQGIKEIISIHITSKASGAYQAAIIAREMILEKLPELKIEVIDTLNASMCQGWMVIEAARDALAGVSLETITAKIRSMVPRSHMLQTADTLRYLYMGGRIGLATSLMGSMLNIKPIVGMEDGVIVPMGKARSRMKAYQIMVDMVEQAVGSRGKIKIAYVHAGALEEVQKIKQLVEQRLNVVESMFAELSPALAVHTGPGTAGLCYYKIED